VVEQTDELTVSLRYCDGSAAAPGSFWAGVDWTSDRIETRDEALADLGVETRSGVEPLRIESYLTILDLGPWEAAYTEGWDRHVVARGEAAKRTKQSINCRRVYPPLNRNCAEILAAANPVVQTSLEVCS
jgi:hypothetical protein